MREIPTDSTADQVIAGDLALVCLDSNRRVEFEVSSRSRCPPHHGRRAMRNTYRIGAGGGSAFGVLPIAWFFENRLAA